MDWHFQNAKFQKKERKKTKATNIEIHTQKWKWRKDTFRQTTLVRNFYYQVCTEGNAKGDSWNRRKIISDGSTDAGAMRRNREDKNVGKSNENVVLWDLE